MLYSENELNKRLKAGCGLYYFYASDEALVHNAAQKALKFLNQDDPETTVLWRKSCWLPVRSPFSVGGVWC